MNVSYIYDAYICVTYSTFVSHTQDMISISSIFKEFDRDLESEEKFHKVDF